MDYRLSSILSVYGGDKDGTGLRIPCPVHHGKDNNCSVWIDETDKIGAVCHSHNCAVTKYLWDEFDPPLKRGKISKELKAKAIWIPTGAADVFNAPRTFRHSPTKPLHDYTSQYLYYNADGIPLNLFVVRYDDKVSGTKCTIPYIFAQLDDGRKTWISRSPNESQWYGLQTLAARDTIVIVEGEKTANAVWKVVHERMGVLSWLGGSGKAGRLDLTVLKDKKVILWPDYDEPGFKWAYSGDENLYDRLKKQGNDVSVVIYDGGKKGFDAADVSDPHTMWEIIRSAGPIDALRLNSLYDMCAAAVAIDMTEEQSKKIECGGMAQCNDCLYKYIPGITHPNQTLNLDPVLHKYAYVASEEAFVDLVTFDKYGTTGFNNICASLPGYSLDRTSCASKAFLESTATLKVHEREFRPGLPLVIDGRLNMAVKLTWRESNDPPDLWLRLGRHLFKEQECEHILDWLAFTIQQPHQKIEHTILLTGAQGAGKSLFFHPIEKALQRVGQHKTVNSTSLNGNFNDFLVNTKLLTMEELNFSGAGFTGSNKLKEWQAAPPNYIGINPKFQRPFSIPNIVNIIAYSNFDLPAKLEQNQRRWYVVKTDVGRLADEDWYNYDDFNTILSDDYIDRILTLLSKRDVSKFQRGNAPRTDAAIEMELMSISGFREIAPVMQDRDWPALVEMREVIEYLDRQLGRSTAHNHNSIKKVVTGLGWTYLEKCIKVNGKSVRPWATRAGGLYAGFSTAELVTAWKRRETYSVSTQSLLSDNHLSE